MNIGKIYSTNNKLQRPFDVDTGPFAMPAMCPVNNFHIQALELGVYTEKSCIRETLNGSTDRDGNTNTKAIF